MVEDNDLVRSTMNGHPYMASRFAAALRRQLFKGTHKFIPTPHRSDPYNHSAEHLGLIPPQPCKERNDPVTSFMKPAPYPNKDEFDTAEDRTVADPLADDTLNLWNQTARKNRDIFTEIFRPVPTNLVRDWKAYEVSDFSVTAFVILDPPPSR